MQKTSDLSKQENEEDEDSTTDCDSPASNRFTVLSEEQPPKESVLADGKQSDTDVAEVDSTIVSEMEKINLDDAIIDSDAGEQGTEAEDEPLEAKEYTVVNQDPELAFRTLANRSVPEKQECSVQSRLFQFTEVETLTQTNSLLCVTCNKQQANKNKTGGW